MTVEDVNAIIRPTRQELLEIAREVAYVLEAQHESWASVSYEHSTSFTDERLSDLSKIEPSIDLTLLTVILTERLEACWKLQTAIADLLLGRNLYSAEMSVVALSRTIMEQCATINWIFQSMCTHDEKGNFGIKCYDGELAESHARALLVATSDLKQASGSDKHIKKVFKDRLSLIEAEAEKHGYTFKKVLIKEKKGGGLEKFSTSNGIIQFDPESDTRIDAAYAISGGQFDGTFVPSIGSRVKTIGKELMPEAIGSALRGNPYYIFSTYSHNPVIAQMMSSRLEVDENGIERYLLEFSEEPFAAILMQSVMLDSVSRLSYCLLGWDYSILKEGHKALRKQMSLVMPEIVPPETVED